MRILTDPKAGASVAGATTGSGLADWLNWIPDDIGKLATVAGILLSAVLIWTHIARCRMEVERHRAKMERLKEKEI